MPPNWSGGNASVGETSQPPMPRALGRRLSLALAGLLGLQCLAAMLTFPTLFPDPAYGLLVQRSMAHGAPWNYVTEPRPDDIARDVSYFHTMWSPGQHTIPGLLLHTGLRLGDALRIIDISAAITGLAGFFWLFRLLRFEREVALAACLFMALSRTFSYSFLAYMGSDQLAFASFPWFAGVVWRWRQSWALVAFAPAALLLGFFMKNSMAIYVGAWIAAVVAIGLLAAPRNAASWGRALAIAVTSAAALGVIQVAYISRGWTPVSYQPSWLTDPPAYLLPSFLMPMAPIGVDDLLSRVFDNPVLPKFDYKHSLLLLVPVVVALCIWLASQWRSADRTEVRRAVVVFVLFVTAAFTVLLASQSGASVYLSRHYFVPGALLLPLVVDWVLRSEPRLPKVAVVCVLLVSALYGAGSFLSNAKRAYTGREAHSDQTRIAHLTLTPVAVDSLGALDRGLPGDAILVVVPYPALAFEFSRARVLATSAASGGVAEFRTMKWQGRVPNLVVVSETAAQSDDELRAWLATFADYAPAAWERVDRGGLSFYVPQGQPLSRDWMNAAFPAGRSSD